MRQSEMTQRLIPIMVFLAVIAIGGAILLVRGWRRRRLGARLYDDGSGFSATGSTSDAGSSRLVTTVEQIGRAVSSAKPEAGLREWLASAGYYDDSAPTVYVGAQLVLGLLALTTGGAVAFSVNLPLVLRLCIVVA